MRDMTNNSAGRELQRGLRGLAVTTLCLFVVLCAVSGYFYWRANQNREALCNVRANLSAQIQASEEFVADVESGERTYPNGITEADIKASIKRLQGTVAALEPLHC